MKDHVPSIRWQWRRLAVIAGPALLYGLTALLAYLLGLAVSQTVRSPAAEMGAMWAAISGIVVLRNSLDDTWDATRARVIGTFVGASTAALYLAFWSLSPVGLGLCVAATVLTCRCTGIADGGRLAAITVVVVMVISAMDPQLNPFANAALRFMEACFGTGVAVLLARLSAMLPAIGQHPGNGNDGTSDGKARPEE